MASVQTVIEMHLPDASTKRLLEMASRYGSTASDTSARLVEEGLRRSECPGIDFRDFVTGRQAVVEGSSLAVWEVMMLVRDYKGDVLAVSEHLQWPEWRVAAAVGYAEAYPKEVEEALAENDAMDFAALQRILPNIGQFVASHDPADAE